jgi:hypothetical protein
VSEKSAGSLVSNTANAGPPYRTDDPEPTEFGHYQLYTHSTGMIVSDDTSGSVPAIEFDYGLIPNGQLTIDAPVAFDSHRAVRLNTVMETRSSASDIDSSKEDKNGFRPQVAIFPLVQFPTGDAGRGLGAGHFVEFFPLWMQKSFGDWTTYGGASREMESKRRVIGGSTPVFRLAPPKVISARARPDVNHHRIETRGPRAPRPVHLAQP